MAALDPSGPSQPTKDEAYETNANPATKEPLENRRADANASDVSQTVDQRIPTEQSSSIDDAQPTALGRGIRGAGAGEEQYGRTEEDVGRHKELDAQQMAMPGEGRVHDAVASDEKPGATGAQQDFASDLDRKKAEQAPAREAIKEERSQNIDVGGILGQRGGPANPVGKDNYPNTGD